MRIRMRPVILGITLFLAIRGASAQTRYGGSNPGAFVWKPDRLAIEYLWQASREADFKRPAHELKQLHLPVCCPPFALAPGTWYWRYLRVVQGGKKIVGCAAQRFEIPKDSPHFVLPSRKELLARVPRSHPRLFLRPEDLPRLRDLAKGRLAKESRELLRRCARLLAKPPSTKEPPLYEKGMRRGSESWRAVWWGNRRRVIEVLDGAATLGFAYLLTGKDELGQLGKRILLACAKWNPKGSTGYRYNDEAGMPYGYYFARSYSFLHALLTEEERALCQRVLLIRGREMYRHLCPGFLQNPHNSHQGRAWHFLGELAIALYGEQEEAADWLWFTTRVFGSVYPAWSDQDGGWHEGSNYWRSYIGRFTWWADIMRSALGIEAFDKPYFKHIGDYPMYLMPPGTRGGGFGDLTGRIRSSQHAELMTLFAAAAQNPYWQWYAEQVGGPKQAGSYVGFLRRARKAPKPRAPTELPSSKCFHGTGQAYLNHTLLDARKNVEVIFKSSPFGTQSHGYEAQNSFLLYAYGERVLIRSGRRDSYGSKHHAGWMWSTRSTNSITFNGLGQRKRSRLAKGRITSFLTTPRFDYVEGEAGAAYARGIDRFRRRILFLKPHLVLILDQVHARKSGTFDWHLHAEQRFSIDGSKATVTVGRAACQVDWLFPKKLTLAQTDRFDPPPRPRVRLVQYHLTARTRGQRASAEFLTALRPYPSSQRGPTLEILDARHEKNAYVLDCRIGSKRTRLRLPLESGKSPSVTDLD